MAIAVDHDHSGEAGAGAGAGVGTAVADTRLPAIFGPAEKHSITIAGHPTSIRIESLFWSALLAESQQRGLPVNALVARIDALRLQSASPPNLASAIRLWLFAQPRSVAAPDQ